MPRNDQAVRQLIVLKKLESSRHGLTLEQLADGLDPSAVRHPRTLRRDLDAIESAGYPLLTERIDGRTRWKLLEGARQAPALRLSPTELMAPEPPAHRPARRERRACLSSIGVGQSLGGSAT